jgi:hypothetical protein
MSVVYNGAGSLVSATTGAGTRVSIFSSTNASPIVVSTWTSHGFNTGDTVEIEGHTTNTPANQVSQITVVDPKHFSLNGTTGIGVGASTGYAINYELLPAIVLPAGGELVDPGGVGAFAEGLANTAPYLYRASGKYKLYNVYTMSQNATGSNLGNVPFFNSGTTSNTTFATISGATGLLSSGAFTTGGFGSTVPVAQQNDILEITMMGSAAAVSASATQGVAVCLGMQMSGFGGSSYFALDVYGGFSGGGKAALLASTSSTSPLPITLTGIVQVPALLPAAAGQFNICLGSYNGTASPTATVTYYNPFTLIVKHYRPN